jgi:hypothetical protein
MGRAPFPVASGSVDGIRRGARRVPAATRHSKAARMPHRNGFSWLISPCQPCGSRGEPHTRGNYHALQWPPLLMGPNAQWTRQHLLVGHHPAAHGHMASGDARTHQRWPGPAIVPIEISLTLYRAEPCGVPSHAAKTNLALAHLADPDSSLEHGLAGTQPLRAAARIPPQTSSWFRPSGSRAEWRAVCWP